MNPRVLAAVGAVAVLGGGSAAFVFWRGARERAAAVDEVVRAADAEIALASVDRDSAQAVLRRLRAVRRDASSAELDRAEARLLLRLDRTQEAWDAISALALRPGAEPDDQRIGAAILARKHAAGGRSGDADQAIALATMHHDATGSVDSLFLAWLVAYRSTSVRRFAETRTRLLADHGTTREGRFVALSSYYLAEDLANRLGIRGDLERFRSLAGDAADSSEHLIARVLVDAESASAGATRIAFASLAEGWSDAPPELTVLLAMADILSGDAAAIRDASERLRAVITAVPASVEARHATVVAAIALGERDSDTCRAQVRWLLANGPADDVRRRVWESLR